MSGTAKSLPRPGLGSSEETLGSTLGSTLGRPAQNLPQIWAALPRTCPRSGQPAKEQIVRKSAYPKVLGSLPGFGAGLRQPARIWVRFWAACPRCCPGLLPGFWDLLPPVKNPFCWLGTHSIMYMRR